MHNVLITDTINSTLNQFLKAKSYSKVAMLADENTQAYCLPKLDVTPDVLIKIDSGEINKTLATCELIWKKMTDYGLDRNALLINLGGGVIGDMGGFCAATYKRGINFINIPTTLLSMVDASVGGKLGIDFGSFKNHIGLFQNPQAVLIDPIFLGTLPQRQIKSGFAEVIKHALITNEDDWEQILSFSFDCPDWQSLIHRAVEIKSNVVEQDWKESGLRKTLNFGHTIGHAVESHYLRSEAPLLHGEAIAIGMIAELYLSQTLCGFDALKYQGIAAHILTIYGKVELSKEVLPEIAELALQDKKNSSTQIKAVLLNEIGSPAIDMEITVEQIVEALNHYTQLDV